MPAPVAKQALAPPRRQRSSPQRSLEASCDHRVVFEEGASYILNLATGEVNWLREDSGNYMLDVWIAPPSAIAQPPPTWFNMTAKVCISCQRSGGISVPEFFAITFSHTFQLYM